ncbi:MAG: hypothetical protein ACTTK5_01310 [Candidatus Fimenecus sp.]
MNETKFEFKELTANDIFPMVELLKKIGFKQLKNVFDPSEMTTLVKSLSQKSEKDNDELVYSVGVSIFADLAGIVIENLGNCKNEIYAILSNASGKSKEEIGTLNLIEFTQMLIAFFKKEEFRDFFKVVSQFLS